MFMTHEAVNDVIRQSIEIAAPIEIVWRLVSEPGWWINDGELEPHEIRYSDGAGGEVIAEVSGHSAGIWRLIVLEQRPHEYAAFRWAPHSAAQLDATGPTGSTLVEFTLREESDHVVVEVVESGFAALGITRDKIVENYRENVEGWGIELAALRAMATR
jgi:uncharacterized protein YndB with AHSA1/START domain